MRRSASTWTALAAALTLLATVAGGTVTTVESAALTPAATVPVTLSSTQGSIVAPFTTATLTGIAVNPITAVTTLTIQHGATAWTVQLVITSRSGFTPIADSVVYTLVGPTSEAVTIGASSPALPVATAAVSLGTTSDVLLTARGVCTITCTVSGELRFTPASGVVPTFALPVTLGVT